MTKCPCCEGASASWGCKRSYGSDWHIYRCPRCGYGFVFPRPASDTVRRFYEEYGGHGDKEATSASPAEVLRHELEAPGSSLDATRVTRVLKMMCRRSEQLISQPPALLDVGCGYGFFSKAATENGFHVTAIELSDHEASVAREVAMIEPIRMSFEDYHSDVLFDAIIMSQILEHALDPVYWIHKSHKLLAPGGCICIAVPNFDSIYRRVLGIKDFMIIPPAHLNFFTSHAIKTLLERNGFEDIRITHITRIPKRSLIRRLGQYGPVAVHFADAAAKMVSRAVDLMRMGGIINAYARRAG